MRYLAIVGAVLAVTACEREERSFHVPEATARPLQTHEARVLVAGEPPIAGAMLDPDMPGYAETAQAVSEGHTLYAMMNCIGCHANGGGAIGPAFLDSEWRYGSKPYDIALSIVEGRPHGMPSYRGKLVAQQVYQLVAYVRALAGMVRGDAVAPRDDHMYSSPARNLTNGGWVQMPEEGK